MYPSGQKQSTAIGTQAPSTLLPSHPQDIVLSKMSHHHCISISANRKGEGGGEGHLEDAHIDSAAGEAGK